jgi:hypothetical protein
MTPGAVVHVRPESRPHYRKPGAPVAGVVQALSPSGSVARIRMDDVADSYVLVCHLEYPESASHA